MARTTTGGGLTTSGWRAGGRWSTTFYLSSRQSFILSWTVMRSSDCRRCESATRPSSPVNVGDPPDRRSRRCAGSKTWSNASGSIPARAPGNDCSGSSSSRRTPQLRRLCATRRPSSEITSPIRSWPSSLRGQERACDRRSRVRSRLPRAAARDRPPRGGVALIESNMRKCAFMDRAIAAAGIPNARVVHSRAEAWTGGLGMCDLVTARALAPLAVLAEYAAPLLTLGGSLVAWRGRRDQEGEEAAARAAAELGLSVRTTTRARPYKTSEHRHLHVLTKVGPTPERYPRRPGMASKRPLGAV